ncbi:MAG: hypothetical protein WA364_03245 [Candidatus Nitrosopolaris sp.]
MVSNTIKYQQIQESRLRESNGIVKGNNNRINAIKSTKIYLISICSSINVMPDYTTTAVILPFDTSWFHLSLTYCTLYEHFQH